LTASGKSYTSLEMVVLPLQVRTIKEQETVSPNRLVDSEIKWIKFKHLNLVKSFLSKLKRNCFIFNFICLTEFATTRRILPLLENVLMLLTLYAFR
jgi:hypothetical protein